MRVLLVEDDEMLGEATVIGLKQYSYHVTWMKDGEAALNAVTSNAAFDTIVLDLGLPKLSGLKVLQIWRNKSITTPVLILTARDSVQDRIQGLDMGADDYLIKPFDLDEMCARIRALYRRKVKITVSQHSFEPITFRGYTLDPRTQTVFKEGVTYQFSRREFTLLTKLAEHAGQVMSREQLNNSLYSWDEEIDSNALEVHIHNIRKRLEKNVIRTIRGVGYLIEADNEEFV